jgi:hypothetical protein
MRNAMVMPIVLVVTLLISMLIGTYIMRTSIHISKEYNRDLAEVRGYWGAYGAKELNVSVGTITPYTYKNYKIDVNKTSDSTWEWNLTIPSSSSSGITNKDIYRRKLTIIDSNKTESYQH